MVKLILDTNIIVSAILKGKNCYSIIEYILSGNAFLCLCDEIEKKYYTVLSYPKFQKTPNFNTDASGIILRLSGFAVYYSAGENFNLIKEVPANRFLELAATSSAQYLITGNTNDFGFDSFFETKIILPADFCTAFNLLS